MLLSDLKPGNIVYLTDEDIRPRFCPIQDKKIQNEIYWSERHLVEYQEPLLFVERFDLNSLTVMHPATVMGTSVAAATETAAAMARAMARADYNQAKSEWKKQKFISGGVFLANSTLVWISHIDLKYFNLGKPKS